MNLRKMQSVAALLAASAPGLAIAATAMPAACDSQSKVLAATYYYSCSAGTHNALDISISGYCGEWNLRGMLVGSYYYKFYPGSCANACHLEEGCTPNYAAVLGANGWDFRQLYIYSNASSASKTCDRCALGLVGTAHNNGFNASTHSENRQYGTRKTAWYTQANLVCGFGVSCSSPVGYPTL